MWSTEAFAGPAFSGAAPVTDTVRTVLVIVCLALGGVLAWAGLLALSASDPEESERGRETTTGWDWIEGFLFGGLISGSGNVRRNWKRLAGPRRLVIAGSGLFLFGILLYILG